jgi:hypothetical protein
LPAEAAKNDDDATVAWLAIHPESISREDILGLANVVTERMNENPAAFLSWYMADGSLKTLIPAVGSALLNQSGHQRLAVWEWIKPQPAAPALAQLREAVLRTVGNQEYSPPPHNRLIYLLN